MGTLRIHVDVRAAAREGAATGLTRVALRTQGESVRRTPLDTGDLRSSQVVDPATPADLEARLSTDSPYARRQHEELSYYHRHGQAKFMESAAHDVAREAPAIMTAAMREALG